MSGPFSTRRLWAGALPIAPEAAGLPLDGPSLRRGLLAPVLRRQVPALARGLLFLGIAVVLALAGTLSAARFLEERLAGGTPAVATRPVWVAATDLKPGDRFAADQARARPWPADALADGQIEGEPAALKPFLGREIAFPVPAGHPLLASHFDTGGAGALAMRIARGRRAVSLAVSVASGLSGLVAPGDRVDVLVAQTLPSGRSVVVVPVSDAKVLGLDQRLGAGPAEEDAVPTTVTLEVTPAEAGALALVGEDARILLALRPPGDGAEPTRKPLWETDVLGLPPALLRPAADATSAMAALPPAPPPAPLPGPLAATPAAEPGPALPEGRGRRLEGGVTVLRGSSIRGQAGAAATPAEPVPGPEGGP